MKRILIFGMTENPGGVESFLMNYYRNIDRNKIQFDFLCNSHELVAYEDELLSLGGRTYHITARSKNRSLYRKELKEVFEKYSSEWDAIWVNVCSLANIDYLKVAKKYGIKKRIIHSHNSCNMDGFLRGILHRWNKLHVDRYATDFWACSEDAAKWFYKKKLLPKALVIHNAIDVKSMAFDQNKRNQIRQKIGVSDNTYLIGNIGRLHFQKNQSFMLDVFANFYRENKNSMLILVGQGGDEEMLREKCANLGLQDAVIFAGVQKDICAWLSAFDLFLFPSLFEGLSVVALEAQANGVVVIASDGVIPVEVKMNNNFEFYSLNRTPKEWANRIGKIKEENERENAQMIFKTFVDNGYEINTQVKKLERLLER